MLEQTPHLLVFAKHDGCSKEFLFAVPYYLEVRKGDVILVNTAKGLTVATATTEMFEGRNIDEVALRYGAYLPLKEVKQVCGKALQTFIENKVRNEIIQNIQDKNTTIVCYELPFQEV